MPIFRSRHQAELLTWLLLHPDQEYTVTEFAGRLGVPLTSPHREAQRLIEADLLRARTVSRARLLRANADHRATAALYVGDAWRTSSPKVLDNALIGYCKSRGISPANPASKR